MSKDENGHEWIASGNWYECYHCGVGAGSPKGAITCEKPKPLSDDERKRMFALLAKDFHDAMSGKFDPKKGGLKLVVNPETGANEMIYVHPVKDEN